MKQEASINRKGLLNLFIVYIVYGSTYLAIRVAVREGAGFPPFTLGMARLTLAGVILLLIGFLGRKRLRPTREELVVLTGSGILFWMIANGLVNWSEQRIDSGLAALIVASLPIWTAIIESVLDRRLPSPRLTAALLIGFIGIFLLSIPSLRTGTRADMLAVGTILIASISWAFGAVLQSRRPVGLASEVSSGYQQLIGGIGVILFIYLAREPKPTPTPQALYAWGYLVVFGSIIAFTAFVQTLKLLPTSVAMTYAYVNPVIAVILGVVILDEVVTAWTFAGAALVLIGVAGVFHDRYRREPIARTASPSPVPLRTDAE